MDSNINENERKFTTKELAERLGIENVTVRKYAQELESKGYLFEKNKANWRLFSVDDIKAMAYFQVLRGQDKSVEDSASKVAELQRSNVVYRSTDTTIQTDDIKSDIEKFQEQQEKFNEELLDRLDKQQKYINERLENRDQQLMQVLKEIQEQKKIELQQQSNRRWWKFWN